MFETSNFHLTRFKQYEEIHKHFYIDRSLDSKVASISGSDNLAYMLGYKDISIEHIDYPNKNILDLDIPSNTYDACVADYVLEHIKGNPFAAVKESIRITKTNGLIVWSVPMFYKIHWGKYDMWRFTPDGLKYLLEVNNAEVLHIGSWGGIIANIFMFLGFGKSLVPLAKWNPFNILARCKGGEYPIHCWCVAKKIGV